MKFLDINFPLSNCYVYFQNKMPITEDSRAALALLKDLQTSVKNADDLRNNVQVNDDLNTLISVLESPVFQSILNIQDSLRELKKQVHLHPSILPEDFDITSSGELILNLPQNPDEDSPYTNGYDSNDNRNSVEKNDDTEDTGESEGASFLTSGTASTLQAGDKDSRLGYDPQLKDIVDDAAQGRPVTLITLYKPDGKSLGFSVVGLKSEHKGELGIYVQEIQPEGIAGLDGQLREGDQILAIDGQVLDCNISHQQAISILQQARGKVDLVVARGEGEDDISMTSQQQPDSIIPSDWCQVEVIDLVNDGTGLGFGIIGGQQTGVVVKTILPGGVADRDGRLLPGDFILQINQHWLKGVASEQVAGVLRSCGTHVRLVVARPVDPGDPSTVHGPAPVLPTQVLNNQQQLEAHLSLSSQNTPGMVTLPDFSDQYRVTSGVGPGSGGTTAPLPTPAVTGARDLPEIETMDVELVKDNQGLGITIAGYTCEREELSGIFVKSVTEGSAADRSGMVKVNDQIVEVDGLSLQGYSNQQAVEMLRSTGRVVKLKLVRYVHGLKFEQLQQAIASSNSTTPVSQPTEESSPVQKPSVPPPRPPQRSDSLLAEEMSPTPSVKNESVHSNTDTVTETATATDFEGDIPANVESALVEQWRCVLGPDFDILVAQISKFKEGGGLGISLEGTVEKVDGEEQNPHHYIRSILPNGPVGQNGRLMSGDELLEVNGKKLLGLYHSDVVAILKDLPMHVRIVCARYLILSLQQAYDSTKFFLRPSKSDGGKPVFSQGGALQVCCVLINLNMYVNQ